MSAYSDKVIADGAVAYWRLGETTGLVANSSVGNFPGTISGGVTLGQAGAISDGNPAMAFDGVNGQISFGSVAALNQTGNLTIEAWIKRTSPVISMILTSMGAGYLNSPYSLYLNAGNPAVLVFYQANATVSDGFGSASAVSDNSYHHVAVTRAGTALTFYIDGVQAGTATLTITPTAVGASAYIARRAADTVGFFPGSIDEVAIYPTALTPQQIAQHYAISKVDHAALPGTLPLGAALTLQQLKTYALPPKLVHVESDVPLEISQDTNGPWVGLAGKFASGGFIRCATGNAIAVCKPRR